MRFYLISDNVDTLTGMRLAGIDGEVVHDSAAAERELSSCLEDESIGIILITRLAAEMCSSFLLDFKQQHSTPLVVEIPDRHGSDGRDPVTEYVRDAVGIKI